MSNQSDMPHHIQLSKSDTELFQTMAIFIQVDVNEQYYHLPQYFKKLGSDVYEVLTFEQLPDYVKEDLKDIILADMPKAVFPLPDGGNYVDITVLRNEVNRIKALGLNTDEMLQYFIDTIEKQNIIGDATNI